MCGIAAIFAHNADAPPVDHDELIVTRDSMINRGPDGEGIWISEDRRTGLGHRRLTIVDLSDAGLQPMWSSDRNLCVTFNGEIYNYPAPPLCYGRASSELLPSVAKCSMAGKKDRRSSSTRSVEQFPVRNQMTLGGPARNTLRS